MTSSKYPDIVNCEKFGDFLGRFGPLVVDAPLPDLISRVCPSSPSWPLRLTSHFSHPPT